MTTRDLILIISTIVLAIVAGVLGAVYGCKELLAACGVLIGGALMKAYGGSSGGTSGGIANKAALVLIIAGAGLVATSCATMKSAAKHATAACAPELVRSEVQLAGDLLAAEIVRPDDQRWQTVRDQALSRLLVGAFCWAGEFLDECATGASSSGTAACPTPEVKPMAEQRAGELVQLAKAKAATIGAAP